MIYRAHCADQYEVSTASRALISFTGQCHPWMLHVYIILGCFVAPKLVFRNPNPQ